MPRARELPNRGCSGWKGHKTVRRTLEPLERGPSEHKARGHNHGDVAVIVRLRVVRTGGHATATRLLPEVRAAGREG